MFLVLLAFTPYECNGILNENEDFSLLIKACRASVLIPVS